MPEHSNRSLGKIIVLVAIVFSILGTAARIGATPALAAPAGGWPALSRSGSVADAGLQAAVTDQASCESYLNTAGSGWTGNEITSVCQMLIAKQPSTTTDLSTLTSCVASQSADNITTDPQVAVNNCVKQYTPPSCSPSPSNSLPAGYGRLMDQIGVRADGLPTQCPASGCSQGSVTGTWQIQQQNGYSPTFSLTQSGSSVTGTMTFSNTDRDKAGLTSNTYNVSGTLNGNQFSVVVNGGAARRDGNYVNSVYSATVGSGSMSGVATDRNVNRSATWSATCVGSGTSIAGDCDGDATESGEASEISSGEEASDCS